MTAPLITGPQEALFRLLHPIFRQCVDPDSARFDLSTPFVVGEFVYATDRRICVRSPVSPEIAAAFAALPTVYIGGEARKRYSEPGAVFEGRSFAAEPSPLPSLEAFPACPKCDGTGKLGWYRCQECDHEHEPDECPWCAGHGRGSGPTGWVSVGRAKLSHVYFFLLARAGAAVYPTEPFDRHASLRFTLPGVEGRVMPGNPDMEDES